MFVTCLSDIFWQHVVAFVHLIKNKINTSLLGKKKKKKNLYRVLGLEVGLFLGPLGFCWSYICTLCSSAAQHRKHANVHSS